MSKYTRDKVQLQFLPQHTNFAFCSQESFRCATRYKWEGTALQVLTRTVWLTLRTNWDLWCSASIGILAQVLETLNQDARSGQLNTTKRNPSPLPLVLLGSACSSELRQLYEGKSHQAALQFNHTSPPICTSHVRKPLTSYAVGTGCGMGGCSGFVPFCSDMGVVGKISSLGSTMLTWSGKGFLGPIFPLGSQGSMIFTLIPSTPKESQGHGQKRGSGKNSHFSQSLLFQ